MSDTYNRVQSISFSNYVFEFSKILMDWRDQTPVPFNLLKIPYATWRRGKALVKGLFLLAMFAKSMLGFAKQQNTGELHDQLTLKKAERLTHQLTQSRELDTGEGSYSSTSPESQNTEPREHGGSNKQARWLDKDLMRQLEEIKRRIISQEGRMLHFRKAIARYCRAMEYADEWLDPLADKVREIVGDVTADLRDNVKTDVEAMCKEKTQHDPSTCLSSSWCGAAPGAANGYVREGVPLLAHLPIQAQLEACSGGAFQCQEMTRHARNMEAVNAKPTAHPKRVSIKAWSFPHHTSDPNHN